MKRLFIFLSCMGYAEFAFAEEFCVSSVELQQIEKLDREADAQQTPKRMEHTVGGAFPLLFNYQTQQKNYKGRDIKRYLFWTLTADHKILGPFNLKQTYYPRFQSLGRLFHYSDYSTRQVHDAAYNPMTQSIFFETDGTYTRSSKSSWTSEQNLVEIPYGKSPTASPIPQYEGAKRKSYLNGVRWDDSKDRMMLLYGNSIGEWKSKAPTMLYKGGFKSYVPVPELGGVVASRGNQQTFFIPEGEEPRQIVGYSRLLHYWGKWGFLRQTADKGWYVTHIGRQYGEASGTYTTTFQLVKKGGTLHVENETRLKPRSVFLGTALVKLKYLARH